MRITATPIKGRMFFITITTGAANAAGNKLYMITSIMDIIVFTLVMIYYNTF